jgi:DNA-binding transcriptional LysR family regulator
VELQQVRYFLALAELGHFGQAARRCGVTQPALTSGIKRLERELEGPLFHRERTGAKLSALGEMVRPRLQRILDDASSVSDIARNYHLVDHAPLRVGILNTIGAASLASFLGRFRALAPGAQLDIDVQDRETLLQRLQRADVEIAVAAVLSDLPEWLVTRPLYRERFVVVMPPDHPFVGRTEIALASLDGERHIDRLACEMRAGLLQACRTQGVSLPVSYRTAHDPWVESMVSAGLGIAFMPEHALLNPGTPRAPLVDPEVSRQVALWRSGDHARTEVGRRFWEILSAHPWTAGDVDEGASD